MRFKQHDVRIRRLLRKKMTDKITKQEDKHEKDKDERIQTRWGSVPKDKQTRS
jgi:hypothetical protein